jgi:hypothetical protein
MESLEQKVENIIEQQEIVISALMGNKLTNQGGIIGQIRQLDKKVDDVEHRLDEKIKTAMFMIDEKIKPLEVATKDWIMFKTKFNYTIFLISIITGFIGALLGLLIAYASFINKSPI